MALYHRFIDKIIAYANLITFRLDAFLQNQIHFLMYIIYWVWFLYFNDISIHITMTSMSVVILSVHYLYAITYALNDFINYYEDRKLSSDPYKFSFYRLRFVQFYGKRFEGFLIQLAYYAIVLIAIIHVMMIFKTDLYVVITTILSFILMSIIESAFKKGTSGKHLAFISQQMLKLFLLSYILGAVFTNSYNYTEFIVFSSWCLIFIGYMTVRSIRENFKLQLNKPPDSDLIHSMLVSVFHLFNNNPPKALLLLSPWLFVIVLFCYSVILFGSPLKILLITITSHLLIAPIWIFNLVLAKILGVEDRTLYQLLKRLILKYLAVIVYYIISVTLISYMSLS